MKTILRSVSFHAFALFLLDQLPLGVVITGGFQTYLLGAILLTIMFYIFKPILNIVSLPINMITFGAFSFIINALILYLLTVFVPQISISAFVFQGISFAGFIIPKFSFNTLFAFIISAAILSGILSFLHWLTK